MLFKKCSKISFRQIHSLINHTIYPINDRESYSYNQFLINCRQEYNATGCLYLKNFITNQTLSIILNEINSILFNPSNYVYSSHVEHTDNLYQTSSPGINSNETESSSKAIIAYDQIPKSSLLRQLYSSNYVIDFITDVIQIYPRLYLSCDPLGALYVNLYYQSNKLSWHTDHSYFFVNLLLQQPSVAAEGIFQYKMKGTNEIITRNDFQAGGLVLFNGRTHPHRVTEVRSSKFPRINAILTYDSNPHHHLSEYVLQKFFGRTTAK